MEKFQIKQKRKKILLFLNTNNILTYSKGKIYITNINMNRTIYICSLPLSNIEKIFNYSRILERLFRIEPRNAISIDNENVLIPFKKAIYRINIKSGFITLEHHFKKWESKPLSLSIIKGVEKFDNCIIYGEYGQNKFRRKVCIYKRGMKIDDKWEIAYEFPPNTIKHIHSVIVDKYRNSIIVLTGDSDKESGIWIAKNNFKDVSVLLSGSQQYRACCAYSIKEGIIYATDTPNEKNYIYIIKYLQNNVIIEKIQELSGSCIYSTQWKDKFVFSSTVEPDSSIKGIRYLFTKKLGKGIKGVNVEIIIGNLKDSFKCIKRFRKDLLPMGLFQYGSVQFCAINDGE